MLSPPPITSSRSRRDVATKTLVFTAATIGSVDVAKSGDQTWLFAYGDNVGFTQHASDARGVADLNFDERIASGGENSGAGVGGAAGAGAGVVGVLVAGSIFLVFLALMVVVTLVGITIYTVRNKGSEEECTSTSSSTTLGTVVGAPGGSGIALKELGAGGISTAAVRPSLSTKGSRFTITSPQETVETRNPVFSALEVDTVPPPLPERPARIRLRPYSIALPFSAASDLGVAAEPLGKEHTAGGNALPEVEMTL